MTAVKPWLYGKGSGSPDRMQFYSIQHQIGETMRVGALLAQPFMPVKATEMLDVLGVDPGRRDLRFALWGADFYYGRKRSPQSMGQVHMFPRLEEIESGLLENMEELMKRRRAEKLASREAKRRRHASGVSTESPPEIMKQVPV